jgi:hypothetical protein
VAVRRDLEATFGTWYVDTETDLPSITHPSFGDEAFIADTEEWVKWNGTSWISSGGGVPPSTPPPTSGQQASFVAEGGQVFWETGYQFRVSASRYYINGVLYSSVEQTITLSAPDGTFDRIDVIALDTTGTVVKVEGTPSATPSEPSIDPGTQLKLALVLVSTGTTEPVAISNVTVYAEAVGSPTEWAWTSSGASIVVNSTSNPYAGLKDIEGTNVVAATYAKGVVGVAIDPSNYSTLALFIRAKSAWNQNRGLQLTLRLAGVVKGVTVQIRRTGTFGFDSTQTASYQLVAIPMIAFAVPAGVTIDELRIEDFGGSIGFYIDNITLQTGAVTPATGGITQAEADARYAPLGSAYAVVGSADATLPNERRLVAGANVTLTDNGPGSTLSIAASGYTDEQAQDAVGGMVDSSLAYNDGGPSLGVATPHRTRTITFVFDGGGAEITVGKIAYLRIPVACTLTAWRILADQVGSITLGVWKDTYANYPPTSGDSITNGHDPAISADDSAEDTNLSDWSSVSVSAGDIIAVSVDVIDTITWAALCIDATVI